MSLYLSRLVLNSKMRMVQRDVGDCQAMHQRIMSAFASISSPSPRNDMGILYKMQSSPDDNTIIAMVQSEQMPDWSILPKGYLMEQVANPAIKDITRLLDRLSSNQRYVFELLACPCRKIGTSTKEDRLAGRRNNGQRVPLKGFEERLAWLDHKGTGYGFNIITVDVLPMQPVYGTYHSTGGEQMKHQGVGYKGILEITHSTLFRKAFLEGIGPAKAYGFGMLMLFRRVAD